MRAARSGFTLIELMIVVAIIGILAAIAIPQFLRFQMRAKQTEVKANLRMAYVAEQAYQHEADTFTESILAIGFSPERGNRYSYVFSTPATYWPRSTATEAVGTPSMNAFEVDTFKHSSAAPRPTPVFNPTVVRGPTGFFTIVGVGNINPYGPLDEWSVSSLSRDSTSPSSANTCASGNNPASEPCQDQGTL